MIILALETSETNAAVRTLPLPNWIESLLHENRLSISLYETRLEKNEGKKQGGGSQKFTENPSADART